MRIDGRAADETRPIRLSTGMQEYAEGSALAEIGRTRVLCAASVEACVPPWVTSPGWVTAEYSMLPRSTRIRTPRRGSARETEISQLIGRALRASLDLQQLGRRTIVVDCDVLQADGGTRTAAITGGYVALALALRRLVRNGQVPEEALWPPVAALSVAILDSQTLLDPCHEEDINATIDCDIVINGEGHLVEVHAPTMVPYSRGQLERMLDLATPAILRVTALQRKTLEQAREPEPAPA